MSGIARVGADGKGSWIAAATAADDAGIGLVAMNSGPALSPDARTVYAVVTTDEPPAVASFRLPGRARRRDAGTERPQSAPRSGDAGARVDQHQQQRVADGRTRRRGLLRGARVQRAGTQFPRLAAALRRDAGRRQGACGIRVGRYGVGRACGPRALLHRRVGVSARRQVQQLRRRRQRRRQESHGGRRPRIRCRPTRFPAFR